MDKMKTKSALTAATLSRYVRWRVNTIANLTPSLLARYLDSFDAGYLREAAGIWQLLEDRDDILRTVIAKRKKSVARHGWAVLPKQGLPPEQRKLARRHVDALEFFYSNLECENSIDASEKGGFKLLARQMLDAIGKRYAVHEIIWLPDRNAAAAEGVDQRFLTARLRFVPLGFFENTTGQLRFLTHESVLTGEPLAEGGWMVTVGDGLMKASSTAWMTKQIALNDWLHASERQGTPALHGTTTADRDSDEWKALAASLEAMLDQGRSLITSATEKVEVLQLMSNANLPFPGLVERIDRMLAVLWRGADLSTISRDRGYGASLQEKETSALEEDDAAMLTETLNRYLDRQIIRYVFGEDQEPLAGVRVLVTPRDWTTMDLAVDQFLVQQGAPLSLQETMLRYGRALPQPGEEILYAAQGRALPHATRTTSSTLAADSPIYAENSAPPQLEGVAVGLGNVSSPADQEWLQLSPYGEFPHARGLQKIDRATAEAMAQRFGSLRQRLKRLFGGVPIYIGHPELRPHGTEGDGKAYGWITELEAREDGLYGKADWSEVGRSFIANGHYKFVSPFWAAHHVPGGFQPSELLSIGLTNQPNLPVRMIGNSFGPAERAHAKKLNETTAEPEPTEAPEPPEAPVTPGHGALPGGPPCTIALAERRHELSRPQHVVVRRREAVLDKLRKGMTYDEAWHAVKIEWPALFDGLA